MSPGPVYQRPVHIPTADGTLCFYSVLLMVFESHGKLLDLKTCQ